jgi:hypothetical protein
MIEQLLEGFLYIAHFWTVAAALAGLACGIIVGALPGLTATMAVAVLTPFTFFMDALIGIPFLLGVYKGGIYGGSIPAILINTPGTAAAAATAIDGSALARRGRGYQALEMSLIASVIADLLATLALIFVAAPLASIALKFGPPEFTMLFACSLTMIAAVSGNSLANGLISAALGVLLACIGLDPMSGYQRFTFGVPDLLAGISLVPLLIGMFALSEILIQVEQHGLRASALDPGHNRVTLRELRGVLPAILRSTGIGIFLGALPGIGAEISCWIAYGTAQKRSKNPDEYGKGSLEGVAAAESGNNAVCPCRPHPDDGVRDSGRYDHRCPAGGLHGPGPAAGAVAVRRARRGDLRPVCHPAGHQRHAARVRLRRDPVSRPGGPDSIGAFAPGSDDPVLRRRLRRQLELLRYRHHGGGRSGRLLDAQGGGADSAARHLAPARPAL